MPTLAMLKWCSACQQAGWTRAMRVRHEPSVGEKYSLATRAFLPSTHVPFALYSGATDEKSPKRVSLVTPPFALNVPPARWVTPRPTWTEYASVVGTEFGASV